MEASETTTKYECEECGEIWDVRVIRDESGEERPANPEDVNCPTCGIPGRRAA